MQLRYVNHVFLNAFEGVTRSTFREPENPENSARKPVARGGSRKSGA